MKHLLLPIALLTLLSPAVAQVPCGSFGVDATVSPPIAALGQPMFVTLTNNDAPYNRMTLDFMDDLEPDLTRLTRAANTRGWNGLVT